MICHRGCWSGCTTTLSSNLGFNSNIKRSWEIDVVSISEECGDKEYWISRKVSSAYTKWAKVAYSRYVQIIYFLFAMLSQTGIFFKLLKYSHQILRFNNWENYCRSRSDITSAYLSEVRLDKSLKQSSSMRASKKWLSWGLQISLLKVTMVGFFFFLISKVTMVVISSTTMGNRGS